MLSTVERQSPFFVNYMFINAHIYNAYKDNGKANGTAMDVRMCMVNLQYKENKQAQSKQMKQSNKA